MAPRYQDLPERSIGHRFRLPCYEREPGAMVETPMRLADLEASATLLFIGERGNVVLAEREAVISDEEPHVFEYVKTPEDATVLRRGKYVVHWRVIRLGEVFVFEREQTITPSPFQSLAVSSVGGGPRFNSPSNSIWNAIL